MVPAAEALLRWACETTAGSEPSAFEPFAAAIEAESDEAADAEDEDAEDTKGSAGREALSFEEERSAGGWCEALPMPETARMPCTDNGAELVVVVVVAVVAVVVVAVVVADPEVEAEGFKGAA